MRVVYAMHVNWQWIRQRPHALAEQLAHEHEVLLLHARQFHAHHRSAEAPARMAARELQRLPGRLLRGPLLQAANRHWLGRQVTAAVREHRSDLLWVTHPDFSAAATMNPALPLVYDCMDDHAAFASADAARTLAQEAALLQRADLVLFSSATLADRVRARATVGRSEVVNNGVADTLLARAAPPLRHAAAGDGPVLGYFGTVSDWFDWAGVLQWLQALPQARLLLAGPVETTVPEHPRVQHVGVLRHDQLAGFVAGCDWLVMPFRVNRLVEAVDPVKLYEYIAFNRPVLAPRYGESQRFLPWVRLYASSAEAIATLAGPAQAPDAEAARAFLRGQSWASRYAAISPVLAGLQRRPPALMPVSEALR